MIELILFFGFILWALITLLAINKVASLYLKGYFVTPVDVQDSDEEKTITKQKKVRENLADTGRAEVTTYDDLVLDVIRKEGFHSSFAARAKVLATLEYVSSAYCIVGCIRSIEGLSCDDSEKRIPTEMCFHVKLIPGGRYRVKTKWKNVTAARSLALSFSIGPMSQQAPPGTKICIRLYGRGTKLAIRPKCYGECYVTLDAVLSKNKPLEVEKMFLPKAHSTSKNTNTFLSSGSEDLLENEA